MYARQSAALLALAMTAATAAHATTIFTVTATYDASGPTENTSITVDNVSGTQESNVVLGSGGFTESLGNLAAGQSVTYSFNQASGPFIVEPGDKGLSDTTQYQVSVGFQGGTVGSALFSPVSNLTGGYVDFLGACFVNEVGCSVDPTVNYLLTGEVAQGVTPVPLPPSLGLFLSGLVGFAVRAWRRT
jgi:hypothetical protein